MGVHRCFSIGAKIRSIDLCDHVMHLSRYVIDTNIYLYLNSGVDKRVLLL